MARKRVAVLISGRGSNMAALIAAAEDKNYPAEIVLVVSNVPAAGGLLVAEAAGIETLAGGDSDLIPVPGQDQLGVPPQETGLGRGQRRVQLDLETELGCRSAVQVAGGQDAVVDLELEERTLRLGTQLSVQ